MSDSVGELVSKSVNEEKMTSRDAPHQKKKET